MIDGGLLIGRNPANGLALDEKSLISFLDRYKIRQAVAAHYKSIFFNYKEGNDELLKICRKYPGRLIPAAIVQPAGFDALQDADYLGGLKKSGFKILAVWTEPHYYDIQLESPLLQAIAQKAVKAGLIVQFGIRNASDLAKVSQYYGKLKGPVLIRWTSGRGYNALSEIIQAAVNHPNFYFDCGSLTSSGTIQHLAGSIGAGRLYFSSGMPENFPFTSHLLLQTSGLNQNELSQIYSGTLSRVLFGKKGTSFDDHPWQKAFKNLLKHPKIDTHWHTDGWNLIEPRKEFDAIGKELSQFNIQKAVFSSIRALNYDLKEGNASLFDMLRKDNRCYGLIVVDPTRIEDSLAEIRKYAGRTECAGIKTIQDMYGMGLDHKNYEPVFKAAEKHNLTVMAHIPGLLEAARQFPKLRFVCAHATFERVKKMFGTPNIWFDIATSHHDPAETRIDEFFEKAGIEKIIFASDGPLISTAWSLGKLAGRERTHQALEKIFQKNAAQAFPKLTAAGAKTKKLSARS